MKPITSAEAYETSDNFPPYRELRAALRRAAATLAAYEAAKEGTMLDPNERELGPLRQAQSDLVGTLRQVAGFLVELADEVEGSSSPAALDLATSVDPDDLVTPVGEGLNRVVQVLDDLGWDFSVSAFKEAARG